MPYINQADRDHLDSGGYPDGAGQLNYLFTCICNDYLKHCGIRYGNINTLVGALDCCKMELYRRIAAPYEEVKLEENGDVYGKAIAGDAEAKLRGQGVEL